MGEGKIRLLLTEQLDVSSRFIAGHENDLHCRCSTKVLNYCHATELAYQVALHHSNTRKLHARSSRERRRDKQPFAPYMVTIIAPPCIATASLHDRTRSPSRKRTPQRVDRAALRAQLSGCGGMRGRAGTYVSYADNSGVQKQMRTRRAGENECGTSGLMDNLPPDPSCRHTCR